VGVGPRGRGKGSVVWASGVDPGEVRSTFCAKKEGFVHQRVRAKLLGGWWSIEGKRMCCSVDGFAGGLWRGLAAAAGLRGSVSRIPATKSANLRTIRMLRRRGEGEERGRAVFGAGQGVFLWPFIGAMQF